MDELELEGLVLEGTVEEDCEGTEEETEEVEEVEDEGDDEEEEEPSSLLLTSEDTSLTDDAELSELLTAWLLSGNSLLSEDCTPFSVEQPANIINSTRVKTSNCWNIIFALVIIFSSGKFFPLFAFRKNIPHRY